MKINFVTIVLDGMPFITQIWPELKKLNFEWQWHVVEGVSANENCTSWCAQLNPRLSEDGTKEYLDSIASVDTRISLYRKEMWHGKVSMFNEVLKKLMGNFLLWQIDSDEIWTAAQISKMRDMFRSDHTKNCARFFCRYFVGPDIAITSRNAGNNTAYEWHRVWRIHNMARFKTHEPPCLENFEEKPFLHTETEKAGLVFDHYAYATEAQVRFKEHYYGSRNNKVGDLYKGAVQRWKTLQENTHWPTTIGKDFMPWVPVDNVTVNKI